jgi:hypothetical protein
VVHRDKKGMRLPIIKNPTQELSSPQGWWREWWDAGARVDANNSLGSALLTLQFSDGTEQTEESNLFSVWQGNGFQIWAGYDAARYKEINHDPENPEAGWAAWLWRSGFFDAVQETYVEGFFSWESEAESKYIDEPMPAGFGLGPGTLIYIGHNPETKAYYEGTIRKTSVDPGCRGH